MSLTSYNMTFNGRKTIKVGNPQQKPDAFHFTVRIQRYRNVKYLPRVAQLVRGRSRTDAGKSGFRTWAPGLPAAAPLHRHV